MKLEITLDCTNLSLIASFWGAVLNAPVQDSVPNRFAALSCGDLTLNFQHVTDAKIGKNRAHLDLLVGDLQGEVARLEALGAHQAEWHEEFGQVWVVFRDPEGNEFCLAQDNGRLD